MSSEYSKSSVSMSRSSYASQGSTYNSTMAPVQATSTQGIMLVPAWGAVAGYNSLMSADPYVSATGYNTISSAYGGADCCSQAQYSTRACK